MPHHRQPHRSCAESQVPGFGQKSSITHVATGVHKHIGGGRSSAADGIRVKLSIVGLKVEACWTLWQRTESSRHLVNNICSSTKLHLYLFHIHIRFEAADRRRAKITDWKWRVESYQELELVRTHRGFRASLSSSPKSLKQAHIVFRLSYTLKNIFVCAVCRLFSRYLI